MSQTQKPKVEQKPRTEEATEPELSVGVETVENAAELMATVEDLSADLDIDDYTAPGSGINHGHGPDKHDVRSAFGVRDEFVEEHFHSAPNDHAAVWELSYRKDEFIAADEPLFAGKSDADASTWSSIESRKSKAPIPDETHRALKGL